jgi:hypothetical protein
MTQPRAFLNVMCEIRERLDELNEIETACGLLPLQEQDRTFQERAEELSRRAILLETWAKADNRDLDTMDLVCDTLAAHVVAFKLAIAGAQETRVESGDAA